MPSTAPVGGQHYPRSVGEFLAWFRTDADCLNYLVGLSVAMLSTDAWLQRLHVLFLTEMASRKAHLTGITANPTRQA